MLSLKAYATQCWALYLPIFKIILFIYILATFPLLAPLPQLLTPLFLPLDCERVLRPTLHPPGIPFSGALTLSRIRHTFSHWDQTRQSSPMYVPGAMDQPMYVLWWWLSLWELPGVQVSWHCSSSYGVDICFSSSDPSPNCSLGVLYLYPMPGLKKWNDKKLVRNIFYSIFNNFWNYKL